jgi:hypothetical protein
MDRRLESSHSKEKAMKTICCVALLMTGYAQAGELLPLSGEESDEVQESIDEYLLPEVAALPDGVTVEPVLEGLRLSGRTKRIFLGPFAGSSHMVLRIRITDAEGVTTSEVFNDEAGAWRGTFQPGNDYEMVERVVTKATEFVKAYGSRVTAQL